jgi:hypothetical protein
MLCVSHWICRLNHRFREQARSHIDRRHCQRLVERLLKGAALNVIHLRLFGKIVLQTQH